MSDILIIDDDHMLCDLMQRQFKRMGHDVKCAHTIEDGVKTASSGNVDVVFLDVGLPDGSGLEALPNIRDVESSPEVIIFTAEGDPDGAEKAIKSGAWDYIEKPPSTLSMQLPLARAIQYHEEKKKQPRSALKLSRIAGRSQKFQQYLDLLAEAAGSEENVLITGETGTGKELFAKAIHENSLRYDKSFVVVDCAALPETLVESMLFGHKKGAFTGADRNHSGLIQQAHEGTLFLDEVGELPLSLQKSFLRVLQERRFRPVGGLHEIKSDFRLVVATNRDLDNMTENGHFREDLLFRLKSLLIELPPLREHSEDIKEIVIDHLRKMSEETETEMKGFSPDFFETLEQYNWPGNIRELLSSLERAIVTSMEEPILFPRHLPTHLRIQIARTSVDREAIAEAPLRKSPNDREELPVLKDYREAAIEVSEKQYLAKLMRLTQKNIKEACRMSGLSRSRLYFLLKKYNIIDSE